MRASYLTLLIGFLLVSLAHAQQPPIAEILPADVRLVIDVSGSMKRTDPNNLRKPAMELLVKLLPDNSRAGIWTFGQSVNLLVTHRTVDDKWRSEAAAKTHGINSTALFTHIGAALEQAAHDAASAPGQFRNNIILLTDGVVDIEASAEVNARERQRILSEILPRLQESGYIIHTIALSDEADKELMEDLSMATDGVFATVSTADELMNTFLRIFDQAVPLERLPLENNYFLVDAAVEEFTALIFRKADAGPTRLLAPDGQKYTAADVPNAIKWHKGPNYDLITVTKPVAGQWQVEAAIDPENRVTVISNLQLVTAPLNNNIEVSQPVNLDFYLQEDDATVTDPQFLQLLDIDAIVTRSSDDKQWQLPLVNPVPPIDGIFHHPLELFRETGIYSIQLVVDGKTFKREYKHQLTVGSPFTVNMKKRLEDNKVAYVIEVSADDQRVDSKKTTIVAQAKNSEGNSALHNFVLTGSGRWQLIFFPDVAARYSLGLQVSGLRTDGEPVREILATQYFTYPDSDDPVPLEVAEVTDEPQVVEEEPAIVAPQEDEAVEVGGTGDENSWLMYSSVALANILVLALAFFGFRMIMGKKAREEIEELEETLNLDVEKLVAEKKATPPPMQELEEDQHQQVIDVADQLDIADIDFSGPTELAPATDLERETEVSSPQEDILFDAEREFADLFAETAEQNQTDDESPVTRKN